MADGVEASTGGQRGRFVISNPRDFLGGAILLALALFALWASANLPGMRGFAFGPGTAPRLFAVLLGAFGILIMLTGVLTKGPKVESFAIRGVLLGAVLVAAFVLVSYYSTKLMTSIGWRQGDTVLASLVVLVLAIALARGYDRGPLFVTAGTLIFAGTIRPMGLVFASFVSILVCSAGTMEVRWREAVLAAAALTIFCALLFVYALNLPFAFWPRF
jgi:putative tricarboxylic transport membrane protein